MDSKRILSADFLDILFEGRNKTYGAYELRKTYSKRLHASLGSMLLMCLVISFFSMRPAGKKHGRIILNVDDVHISSVEREQKPEVKTPDKKPLQVRTQRHTTPIIVDQDVDIKDEIKPVDELAGANIGVKDVEGVNSEVVAAPVQTSTGTAAEAPKPKDDIYDGVVVSVSIEAKFKGGTEAWRKFLERNLNNSVAVDNGAPAGSYRVLISFIVDKEGNISDVKPESDPGYGTAGEAVRVLKKSPKWEPAQQNGHFVGYRQKQSITFVVQDN